MLALAAACVVEVPVEPPEGAPEDVERIPEGAPLVGVGGDAEAFLRADVPRLAIEVNAAEGHALTDEALAHLEMTLEDVLDKPGGIEIRTATFSPPQDSYTMDDLSRLEQQHRQTRMTADEASLHILALNGDFMDMPVVGVAFSSSSFAVFPERIGQGTTPFVSQAAVERAVLVHEMGHLLRLVNIGFASPREREDPDSPHHSENEESAMYWAVESVSVVDALRGGPPDTFDADDLADLEDVQAGRLP